MHDDRQRPDLSFAGSKNLVDQKITPGIVRSIGKVCEPEEWSAVFELSVADLGDGNARNTHVTADPAHVVGEWKHETVVDTSFVEIATAGR
jgi:hypothetical protein